MLTSSHSFYSFALVNDAGERQAMYRPAQVTVMRYRADLLAEDPLMQGPAWHVRPELVAVADIVHHNGAWWHVVEIGVFENGAWRTP